MKKSIWLHTKFHWVRALVYFLDFTLQTNQRRVGTPYFKFYNISYKFRPNLPLTTPLLPKQKKTNLFLLNKFRSFYTSSIMIDCQKNCLMKDTYVDKIIQSSLSIIFKSKSNVYSLLILMSCSIQRFNILLLFCQSMHEMRHEKIVIISDNQFFIISFL